MNRLAGAVFLGVLLAFQSVGGSQAAAYPGSAAAAPAGEVGPNREVFAFFTPKGQDYMLSEADYSTLTTVAYFGVNALPDGSIETSVGGVPTKSWTGWTSDWMGEVIAKAHLAGCKVVLGVKRFAWSDADRGATIALLSDADARARLANEIADAVTARGADGVNLDFEPIPREVKYDYVTFVRLVRQQLDLRQPGLFLTFDATARPSGYRISELTAEGAADAVFVMGYPFKSPRSKRAGAVSPLAGVSYGLPETVDVYMSLTSADKIILGLPYYGYEWSTETKGLHSLTRPPGATYGYQDSQQVGYALDFGALHGRRWDSAQLVAWTRWRYQACETCPTTWRQLYYDDVESLGLKYDMILERNLGGVGIFKIGNDAGHPELRVLLDEKFGSH